MNMETEKQNEQTEQNAEGEIEQQIEITLQGLRRSRKMRELMTATPTERRRK